MVWMPEGSAVVELTEAAGPCSLEQHCGDYFAPIAQLMGLRHSSWPAQQAVVDAAATTAENATATTTEMFVDHLHAALRMVLQA